MDDYFYAGKVPDFEIKEGTFSCSPIAIPQSNKRVNIVNSKGKLYAVNNVCPHKAAPLHRGTVTDIEDIAKISCLLHGWTFSLHDGKSDANSFVLDIYDIKIKDDQVWVSFEKKNSDIEGDRRDFNGQELIYNPGLGWI